MENKLRKVIKISFSALIFVVIVAVSIVLFVNKYPKEPFKDLTASDLESVSVTAAFDGIFELNKEETEDFTKLLNDIVIYKKTKRTEIEYGNQYSVEILKKDGTTISIAFINPISINGDYYTRKAEPCEKAASYIQNLTHEKFPK